MSTSNERRLSPRLMQLRERIHAEGGVWDGKRALATYREMGFQCTLQRARANLKGVAERFPGLLVAVEGKRYTWEAPSRGEANSCKLAEMMSMGEKLVIHREHVTYDMSPPSMHDSGAFRVVFCPGDMPPTVVNMLSETVASAWRDFTAPDDPSQTAEAFWTFLTNTEERGT